MKWKGLDSEEGGDNSKKATEEAEKYLATGKKFNKAWVKFDKTKQQSGMIDMTEAHEFINKVIKKDEISANSTMENQIIKDLI